ncbi:hypothetical protein Tco_0167933 [Tanacetum coccineum]
MDSENDNEKVIPSIPSPEPAISCFDDLDFLNDFENEFPAIVYNDAQMSKLDLLTEPILSPQHIREFNLNDQTSVFEYDEKEQNILYFNDIFPFNITRPDDLNSEKNNNDNDIDIIFGQTILDLDTPGALQFQLGGARRRMDIGSVNVPYLLARYLRLFSAGRKSGAHISGGQFVARLAEHFGLLTVEILRGLTVIAPELSIIDMAELLRLQICA